MVTMRAAVYRGVGRIELAEVPRPEPGPGEALIRVGYCGICGSDLEAYHTGMYEPGLILGHEFAGTIVALGPDAGGWQTGERVVASDALVCGECRPCREGRLDDCASLTMVGITHDGAMADYVRISARALHRLPAGVSLRQGALVEPLSVALHGVRRSRLRAGDRALVMGAGPIGLLTAQCALLAGARLVAVSEVDPARAGLARRLGASMVLDPGRENVGLALADLTDGLGPDVIYVCTGAPGPLREAISLVRKGGQIFILGLCTEPVEADLMSVTMGELSIEGGFCGRAETGAAVDLIAQGRIKVEELVSHELGLEAIEAGFRLLSTPGSGGVKVLIRIGGEA